MCFPPLFYPILLLAQFFKATQFPHQGCLHRLGGLVWFGFFFAPRWMELCWVAKDEASPCKVGNHSRKHLHHQLQRQGEYLFLEVLICFVMLTQWFNFRLCFLSPLHVMDLIIRGRTLLVQLFDAFLSCIRFLFLWKALRIHASFSFEVIKSTHHRKELYCYCWQQ